MSNETSDHNLKAIRQLLIAAFIAEGFRSFLEDHRSFRPIVAEFGPGHGLTDMVDEAVTYCRTHLLLDDLLAEVKQTNPRQYARFALDLYTPEKVRKMELDYLDDLLARYEYWLEHYTPPGSRNIELPRRGLPSTAKLFCHKRARPLSHASLSEP